MGIDIYLNGYAGYNRRIKKHKAAFDDAVKLRDSYPRESVENKAAQELVNDAYDKMCSGNVGYLRSSYNGGGLFRVLEELFGFDVGNYLFPGDWGKKIPIDGAEFVAKVEALQKTALAAMAQGRVELPWIDIFTAVTGERAPDPNETRVSAEAFGDSVFKLISGVMGSEEMANAEGGPVAARPQLTKDHGWYLTEGLRELHDFGVLAKRYKKAYAYISY